MKRFARSVLDLTAASCGRLGSAAFPNMYGWSTARASIKLLFGIFALLLPMAVLLSSAPKAAVRASSDAKVIRLIGNAQPVCSGSGTRTTTATITATPTSTTTPAPTPVPPPPIIVTNLTDPVSTSANGFCTLREAINNANNFGRDTSGGDCVVAARANTIVFFDNLPIDAEINLSSALPQIASGVNLTISGSGGVERSPVINGGGSYQVLNVAAGASLTLKGLTIANGKASSGGGASNSGALTINNSTFTGNVAAEGGAVFDLGTLSVTNSLFSGNSASAGNGGGVESTSVFTTIVGSTFSGNTATGDGGGLNLASAPTIMNNTFSSNSAASGGAIFLNGTVSTMTGNSFSMNHASMMGGGLYTKSTLNLRNNSFSGNTAQNSGGAIFNAGTLSTVLDGFSGNSASLNGGGLASSGSLTINSNFSNNTASNGGAVHSDGTGLNVVGGTFSGNVANDTGGAIRDEDTLTVAAAIFSGNNAPNSGGAIYAKQGATITTTTFAGNFTTTSGATFGGGAIYAELDSTVVKGCTFNSNTGSNGGAISIPLGNGASLDVTNSTFSANSAVAKGGAVFASGPTRISSSTLAGNLAGGAAMGGAIYRSGDVVTITNSILTSSGASGNCAGGVTNGGDNISDDASCAFGSSTGANGKTIGDNIVPSLSPLGLQNNGGPTQTLALQPESPAIDAVPNGKANCPGIDQRGFSRPDAEDGLEGACDIGAFESTTTAIVVNTTSDFSSPGDGACTLREAITNANNPGTDATCGDCATTSVPSSVIGFSINGTIQLGSSLPPVANQVMIDGFGRSVTIDGASLVSIFTVAPGASLNLNELTLTHAFQGAINNGGNLMVSNSTFVANIASVIGGAIYNNGTGNNGTVAVTNSTFSGNQASQSGSAIFNQAGSVSISNCTIAGNSVANAQTGGAIYGAPGTSFMVTNSILAANSNGNCGGTTFTNGSHNISDDVSCGFGSSIGVNGDTIGDNVDPLLDAAGLSDNGGPTKTIALQSDSPAIDAIPLAICPSTDQRGAPRPDPDNPPETACDIGALESGEPVPFPTVTPSIAPTPSAVATPTITLTSTPTTAVTATPSITLTPTAGPTPFGGATLTPTITPTTTATLTPTMTPTPTPTPTPVGAVIYSPKALKFAKRALGKQSPRKFVTMTNPKKNKAAVSLTGIALQSQNSGFAIDAQKTTCIAGQAVAAGKKCRVAIVFSPATSGPTSNNLSITGNMTNPPSVTISGTGR